MKIKSSQSVIATVAPCRLRVWSKYLFRSAFFFFFLKVFLFCRKYGRRVMLDGPICFESSCQSKLNRVRTRTLCHTGWIHAQQTFFCLHFPLVFVCFSFSVPFLKCLVIVTTDPLCLTGQSDARVPINRNEALNQSIKVPVRVRRWCAVERSDDALAPLLRLVSLFISFYLLRRLRC